MTQLFRINEMANRIHAWGEPEQYPWKAMALTRVCSVGLAVIEAANVFYSSLQLLVWRVPLCAVKKTFNVFSPLVSENYQRRFSDCRITKTDLNAVVTSIVGLASTLFFGIVFSPEMNFRVHQNLGLVVENSAERKEKALRAELEAEIKRAISQKERTERLNQFRSERDASDSLENQADQVIDSNLEKLLAFYKPG